MFKHIVFFRVKKDGKERESIDGIVQQLRGLPMLIPQIAELEVGVNMIPSPAAADISLYTSFKNKEAFEIYRDHPEHQKVVSYIVERIQERQVVDYEDA